MVDNQAYLFLIFIINGIIIGMLFDFFRILRRSFKTKDFVTYIEDILFWILTGFIILYSIFTFNNGEIRLYIFLGVMLGASIYMLTISKYIMKISVLVMTTVKKITYSVFKIVLYPFNFIYKILKKLLMIPTLFLKSKIRKIFNKINQNISKTSQNIKIKIKKSYNKK